MPKAAHDAAVQAMIRSQPHGHRSYLPPSGFPASDSLLLQPNATFLVFTPGLVQTHERLDSLNCLLLG